jgi:predicted nucleotidyltransferase
MTNEKLRHYLTNQAAKLAIAPSDREKIDVSINSIKQKLELYFKEDGLREVRVFGSYDRNTLMNRDIDVESDVDILVVFEDQQWQSQTYLNKFKQFAETYYSKSEVYQDHPTIVIKLGHIKFELVPCRHSTTFLFNNDEFFIPKKQAGEVEWIETEPNELKDKISEYKGADREQLLNLILLFKYWNLDIGFQYNSFQVENFVLKHFYRSYELEENFFRCIDHLSTTSNSQPSQNGANVVAKMSYEKIDILLDNHMEEYALMEIKKILPEIN